MKSSMPSDLKIFGTFGPSAHTFEVLDPMVKSGMNAIRLNTNHCPLEQAGPWIEAFEKACQINQIRGEILIDLKGKAIRTGQIENFTVEKGQVLSFNEFDLDADFIAQFKEKDLILFGDEAIQAVVENNAFRFLQPGLIKSHQNLSRPGKPLSLKTLSREDEVQLLLAEKNNISSIMIPFVQSAKDLQAVRRFLNEHGLHFRIYAKIENQFGIDHLGEIAQLCDEIVIARGDLALNTGLINIGANTQRIVDFCHKSDKPYMIVTQMLHHMIDHPLPTRAEVNDVFQAVYQGASSIMLTNETAAGKYPVEAMQTFCEIAGTAKNFKDSLSI